MRRMRTWRECLIEDLVDREEAIPCLFWGELQSAKQKGVTVLAQRKPKLLFVFVGVLLLRLATRTFCAVLFQEPPRKTREPRLEPSWASAASTTESNTF